MGSGLGAAGEEFLEGGRESDIAVRPPAVFHARAMVEAQDRAFPALPLVAIQRVRLMLVPGLLAQLEEGKQEIVSEDALVPGGGGPVPAGGCEGQAMSGAAMPGTLIAAMAAVSD